MSCINVSISRVDGISANTSRLDGINAATTRLGGIMITTSLVCDYSIGKYLIVVPTEVQWVDVSLFADYNVSSNTNWLIE